MEELTCRLLPLQIADGPANMATDEALLRSAASGVATLRFYRWSESTVSLGYFQPARLLDSDPHLQALPLVRRATGGATLVHHHELTYALALPHSWLDGPAWAGRMHQILAAALADFGVAAHLFAPSGSESKTGPLCFHHLTAGDLVLGTSKVVGSAQRKSHGALLQHGGVLLARSCHAPSLPGIEELAGVTLEPAELADAVAAAFVASTSATLVRSTLDVAEEQQVEQLVSRKYATRSWNQKR